MTVFSSALLPGLRSGMAAIRLPFAFGVRAGCIRPLTVTRTFYASSRFGMPAAKTASKPKGRKTTAKSSTAKKATAKKTTAKKAAPKKKAARKAAPKKKKTAKKVVKQPVFKITQTMMPPKRPLNPFLHFAMEEKASMPPATSASEAMEHMKVLSAKYQQLSPSQKKVFEDRAAQQSAKYATARAEWERNIDPSTLRKMNKVLVAKGKRRLRRYIVMREKENKKPLTSFFRFYADYRASHDITGRSLMDVSRDVGVAWKNLPAAEREVYKQSADQDAAKWRGARARA
ncbi:hypothetical protein FISHEDRAFT_56138 [Fistulina hepatica ATCC 64428]|uniref:HMG box domain-containing protein n=1 Tax=Fistulina hepatica ATCC 64428 TaxID=1128425 RepID=A0A0D7ALH1_9AGAR|nr:hypothetical protein FISHEDRAFT_56138 [Fistulina hepatica ATCC 64428]